MDSYFLHIIFVLKSDYYYKSDHLKWYCNITESDDCCNINSRLKLDYLTLPYEHFRKRLKKPPTKRLDSISFITILFVICITIDCIKMICIKCHHLTQLCNSIISQVRNATSFAVSIGTTTWIKPVRLISRVTKGPNRYRNLLLKACSLLQYLPQLMSPPCSNIAMILRVTCR